MRLVRAITASDLQNSGYNNAVGGNAWARVGKTPLYVYISTYGANFVDANGFRANTSGTYFTMHIGTAWQQWQPNEEFGLGYQLVPYRENIAADGVQNKNLAALRLESSGGLETICMWQDIYPFTDEGAACFIEYRISYDLKTVNIMVNGRLAKTVTTTLNHTRNNLAMYFYSTPNNSGFAYVRNIYMAFFDPAVEKPYLSRWNCEVLTMGATDFPNSAAIDGTVDTLGAEAKNVEFTYAGTAKLKAVMMSGYGAGAMDESLEVKMKSGATETTLTTSPTPTITNSESGLLINPPNGMLFGSVDFDNTSKKVTATLKLNN